MNDIIRQKNINLFISLRFFQNRGENFERSIYSNFLSALFQYVSVARKYVFFVMKSLVMDQAGCLEDTPLLPQRVKSGSIPGFAPLSLRSRSHARSAFHTVFSTPSLIHFIPRICGFFPPARKDQCLYSEAGLF
jgi:hypothetical protein